MKSIKEKAENLYPDKKVVLARGNTCLSCGRVKRESFEAGANYVLECLERAIELNESTFVYSREKYIKVQVLNEFIEKIRVK